MNAKFMPMIFSQTGPRLAGCALNALHHLQCIQTKRRAAKPVSVVLVWAAMAAFPNAHAEKADRTQPLAFAADAAKMDDAQHLHILTGNVEITKGSMAVRSDRVEVRQNTDGSQTATATGGAGGRAYFRQKRDGVDEAIEGEADKVVYEGKPDTVRFSGRAVMRRLSGKAVIDEVSGDAILYNNKTSVFQVLGEPDSGHLPREPKGRVRGVISPRAQAADPSDQLAADEKH